MKSNRKTLSNLTIRNLIALLLLFALLSVDLAQARASTERSRVLDAAQVNQAEQILKAAVPKIDSLLGSSVAISGNTLVASAPWETTNLETDAGAIYVFEYLWGSWVQQAYLRASNFEGGDLFGLDVAIDGNTIVVGAMYEDSDGSSESDNSATDAGAVYIFERNTGIWTQQAYLKASNVSDLDQFGSSVAIQGNRIVVGARSEGGSGAAYVFERSAGTWTERAYLKAANADIFDYFGDSVALDGELLVVGATREDSDGSSESDNLATHAGAAYVFRHTNNGWIQHAYLKAVNAEAYDSFGSSVAISGNTVVVGARDEDSDGSTEGNNSMSSAGAVYIFERLGNGWMQQAYLKASNPDAFDCFGCAIAIRGDTVLIGASGESSDGSSESNNLYGSSGAVYRFERNGYQWTQEEYLKASTPEYSDRYGASVAMGEEWFVIGAPYESTDGIPGSNTVIYDSGAAYVYANSATSIRSRMTESIAALSVDQANTNHGATLGTASITIDFLYTINSGGPVQDVYFQVTEVNNTFLTNGDSGQPEGVGSILSIDNVNLPSGNGLFEGGETLTVLFEVGLTAQPSTIDIAMYGIEVGAAAAASPTPLATFTLDSAMLAQANPEVTNAHTLFLPLVNR